MKTPIAMMGALLLAALPAAMAEPARGQAADPRTRAEYILSFALDETKPKVVAKMGQPSHVGDFGANYQTWNFQIDVADKHDYSHVFCFDQATRTLVSITRNTEEQENVDELFPEKETETKQFIAADKSRYSVRMRTLPGGRVLLAMGVSKAGQPTSQLVLIRRSALTAFFPWIEEAPSR